MYKYLNKFKQMSSYIISQDQVSSFDILQKQINELKNEICDIKHQNNELLRSRNTDKEEIKSIKRNVNILTKLVCIIVTNSAVAVDNKLAFRTSKASCAACKLFVNSW